MKRLSPRKSPSLPQDRDERVVGALLGEVVVVAAAQVRRGRPPAVDLEARRAQQQRMQLGECRIALGAGGAEPLDPDPGLPVDQGGCL